ncbi:SRPBCC family protein [Dyadobacter psychrotolerans]|uniref:SRPBCC domain-containing protein n=1 Tax=Dyadobacter psychrotolerans TaxID=2541721 RepID=A0A4R5DRQ3_9BACT|nr:SRPBCC domain-containing protein [Dyadobacter psychrotolerans]TDE17126.1 SRPBCC domain-containing protein [Dyadobacter psychrotolerans]
MDNYTRNFITHKSPKQVYELLLDVKQWWSGIYDEIITGESQKENDTFSFSAGGGMHFSEQILKQLIPYKRIVWEVTESNLAFLSDPNEWAGTKLIFDIQEITETEAQLTFTHEGLKPQIECYGQCSNAWTQYFQNLQQKLN